MSDDTKRTDVAQGVQTEEVLDDVEAQKGEPSEVNDQLNINELIAKPKSQLKSKEGREGLSRKEVVKQKADQPDKYEELQSQIESLTEQVSSFQGNADELRELKDLTEQTQTEAFVRNALNDKSVSDADFNKNHKSQFLAERDELIADGMTFGKAVKKAMQIALANVKASEQVDTQRAVGRNGAKLPGSSTVSDSLKSIKKSTLANMPVDTPAQRVKYNAMMSKVEAGEVTVI